MRKMKKALKSILLLVGIGILHSCLIFESAEMGIKSNENDLESTEMEATIADIKVATRVCGLVTLYDVTVKANPIEFLATNHCAVDSILNHF